MRVATGQPYAARRPRRCLRRRIGFSEVHPPARGGPGQVTAPVRGLHDLPPHPVLEQVMAPAEMGEVAVARFALVSPAFGVIQVARGDRSVAAGVRAGAIAEAEPESE